MKYINNEIVNSGIWECIKKAGSLAQMEKDIEGVGRSTIRNSLYKSSVNPILVDACVKKYGVKRDRFESVTKVSMDEEEI